MRQLLIFVAAMGGLALWTLVFALCVTGSWRHAVRYLRTWAGVLAGLAAAGAVVGVVALQLIPPP